jgi:hypothetical protein
MCSWQKAAWLGFKSADPQLIVGWNPTAAVPTPQHTEGLFANDTHAFFDTYNIHTYDWFHDYVRLWTPARAAAAAKPLWITEADRGMKHLNNPPDFDLPWPGERLKAEALIQEYALSLASGAARHFHFILGHYHEPNGVQFGLLRRDLTPRPAYVALAATGRFLAGAQFLGHWQPGDGVHVVAFHARPDGHDRDVVVLWAENPVDWDARGQHTAPNPLPMEMEILAIHDYLGRRSFTALPQRIGSAPQFVILPREASRLLPLETHAAVPSPHYNAPLQTASPLVLQILWPEAKRASISDLPWSEGHVYTFEPGESVPLQIAIYNFGDRPAEGTLAVELLPEGWSLNFQGHAISLAPGQRQIIEAEFMVPPSPLLSSAGDWIRVRGDFLPHSNPVVAFRCVARQAP